jgi:hypothetical protein
MWRWQLMQAHAVFVQLREKVEHFYNKLETRVLAPAGSESRSEGFPLAGCKLLNTDIQLRLERVKARVYESNSESTKRAAAKAEERDELGEPDDQDTWRGLRNGDAVAKEEKAFLRAFSFVEVDSYSEV